MTRYRWTYADGADRVEAFLPSSEEWKRSFSHNPVVKCEALPAKKVTRWRYEWSVSAAGQEPVNVWPTPPWDLEWTDYKQRHLVSCVRVEVDAEDA